MNNTNFVNDNEKPTPISSLVSVLICAYNVEKYIAECLEAVINQTYSHLEIIIVNDGSTDSTLSILESFAQKDSRIKIISNKNNLGFITSLNKGLSFCSGEFIARTDADDIVCLDWIESILQYMVRDGSILAMGGYVKLIVSEDAKGYLAGFCKNGDIWYSPLKHEDIVKKMPLGNPMHNTCILMRSDIYNKYHLIFDKDYIYAEDYKFWFEVSKLGKLANINKVLVKYRIHEQQVSSLYHKIQNQTTVKIRREILDYYFSDKKNGINFTGDITTEHIEHIISIENDKVFLQKLIYDLYCSLAQYDFNSFKEFLLKHIKFLSLKQRINIIKRFLRPYKSTRIL